MTLYLVRHARTRWSGARYCGRTDLPLSDEGRAEARAAAVWLGARCARAPRIVSSPRARAMESARLVAAPWKRVVETDARLREVDFGDAEGLTFAELERGWPELAGRLGEGNLGIDWPDGERTRDFSERVVEFWRERTGSGVDEDLVVVTHGGPARHLLTLAGAASPAALAPAEIVVLERTGTPNPTALVPAEIVTLERIGTPSAHALAPAEAVALERTVTWRVAARWRPGGSASGAEVSR